tara:strand:+ start:173 stop:382 length:210 start_codon:yes stop_codon:yes gene_type:complete
MEILMIKDPTLIKLNLLDFNSPYTLDLKKERLYGRKIYSKPLSNSDRDIKKPTRSLGFNKWLGGVLFEK